MCAGLRSQEKSSSNLRQRRKYLRDRFVKAKRKTKGSWEVGPQWALFIKHRETESNGPQLASERKSPIFMKLKRAELHKYYYVNRY